MYTIVLLRHGQSTWNAENRFTGWTDVDLTEKGRQEAHTAAKQLKEKGFTFDHAYCNMHKRAIDTLLIVLDDSKMRGIPIDYSWRLNERHYGALQGLNKTDTAKKYGEEQFHLWRRGYATRPPTLTKKDPRWPGNDPRYKDIPKKDLPLTECLKDTVKRVLPYWKQTIAPSIKKGEKILISASGNSIRAIVKYLDNIPENKITELNIPTGIPLVYELNNNLTPIRHYYLADEATLKKAIETVKNQGTVTNQGKKK